jgi:alpha-tubulin suppressor-like RCC1 family protein
VAGLETAVQTVAAGSNHSCALTTSGAVKCWGDNTRGQLGDGTTTNHTTAEEVHGLSAVQAIAGGLEHTCALTTAGGAACWGANLAGQLGVAPTWTPVDVITRIGFDLHLPLITR